MGLTQVSTDGVKNDAITKVKIPANQIEASELADNAVDTNAIADGAVTKAKIENLINNNADNRVITGSGTANTLNGETNVVIDSSGKLLVGTTSASQADSSADDLVLGNTGQGNNGMTIVSGNANNGAFFFADQDGTVRGGTRYQHGADVAQFYAGGNVVLNLKNKGVGINENSPNGDALIIRGGDTDDTPSLILKRATDGTQSSGETIGKLQFTTNENNVDSGNYQPRVEIQGEITDNVGGAAMKLFTAAGSATSPTERMRIDSSGNLVIKGSATSNNARMEIRVNDTQNEFRGSTDSGTNKGFAFYANNTNNSEIATFDSDGLKFGTDTAAASALDDYEEGTWTPTSNIGSMTVYSAHYVKIGKAVTVQAYIEFPSMSGSSGVNIAGFPFSAGGGDDRYSCAVVSNANFGGYQILGQLSNVTLDLKAPDGNNNFSVNAMSQKIIAFSIAYTMV